MMKEYMILGLRLIDGISLKEFERKFNEELLIIFQKEIEKLINKEYILINNKNIKLSHKGIDFANCVWGEFL